MRRNDPFGSFVTPGYKVQSAGEVVMPRYKIQSAGEVVTPRYKIQSAGEVVTPRYKIQSAGEAVTPRYKIQSAGEAVTPGYKIRPAGEAVTPGYKNAAAGGDKNPVSTGYKNVAEIPVSGGYKTGSAQIAVSGGHKNLFADNGDNASPASAARMDAFTGTAWTAFAATGRDGMVFFAAGRGAFTVAGCFEQFVSGIRCAGCGYVVMNLFFACRDGFIFPRFVISFLPLKEPLRARGIFLCWRFYEC